MSGLALAHAHMQIWNWPLSERHAPKNIFSEIRETDELKFRAGSSECLSGYPVFREWVVSVVPPGVLVHEQASLLAACRVVDGFLALRGGYFDGDGGLDAWHAEIVTHVELFKLAYPDRREGDVLKTSTVPKHHYALHTVDAVRAHSVLQTAFVCERKHKHFKEAAVKIKVTNDFELAVVRQLTLRAARVAMDGIQLGEVLSDARPHPRFEGWLFGRSASYFGSRVYVHDFVKFCDGRSVCAGVVIALVRTDLESPTVDAIISPYVTVDNMHWSPSPGAVDHHVPLWCIIGPCIWTWAENDSVRLLNPGQLEWLSAPV